MSSPAASPPAGQTANFADPETTHRETGLTLAGVGMLIMTSIMLLRLYTKIHMFRLFGIDDGQSCRKWLTKYQAKTNLSLRLLGLGAISQVFFQIMTAEH